MAVMGWQAWATVAVVAAVIGTLTLTRIGPDLVMVAGLTALLTLGVLEPADALAGFANEAVVTVGLLFVVAAGLRETGAIGILTQRVLGRPRSITRARARMMLPVAALSSIMSNLAVVAVMLPAVDDWAKRNRITPSKLMIPLSYAAVLGSLCTLIGTSTNLIVNGLLVSQAKLPGLSLFDTAWLGLPCAAAGLAYILIFGRWLLPDRGSAFSVQDDPRQYTVEMMVEPGSSLVGKTIEEAGLRQLPGLYLVEIERGGQVLAAVGPQEQLQGDDHLVFAGVVDSVVDLQKMRGLKPATTQVFKLDSPRWHRCLIEAVVSNSCPLVGRTIREGRFRTVYNAAIIALARNGERLRQKIGEITLKAGDTLLLEAHPWFLEEHRNSRDFFLMSRLEDSTPIRHERAWMALAILFGMVIAAGLRWLSMLNAAMLAAGLMMLARCCSGPEARRSVNWQVLVVIAAALGIGRALEVSGVASIMAGTLIGLAGNHPWAALAVVYGMTMLFTELMSHTAAAVLAFPIGLAAAHALHVNFMPFAMAILIAASCGFATPISHLTNLMVYGPGSYRFSDFLRFGIPLNFLVGTVAVALGPVVWPFYNS